MASIVDEENYGVMPFIQSTEKSNRQYLSIRDINETLIKQIIWIRGRFQMCRHRRKQCLFIISEQSETILGYVSLNEHVSQSMMKFITKISDESIIDLQGEITLLLIPYISCTQKNLELQVKKIFVVSSAESHVHLQVGICKLFRDILDTQGFLEIHTPKITAGTDFFVIDKYTFKMSYFNTKAYLTQQLHQEMAIAADFEKVYTIGSVFHSINVCTYRHLTEFICLRLEMSFNYHYHEVLNTIGDLFIQIFKDLAERFSKEIEIINREYPCESFQYVDPPLCLTYKDAIALLTENGIQLLSEDYICGLESRELARIIKAKYHTDFYIIDKYPLDTQPFYTMPDPKNSKYSNSYNVFLRGDVVLSGSQHIHDVQLLLERIKDHQINMDEMKFYIDAFRYGCAPHAGGQMGLERVLMLYLGLCNIRNASMFPRDAYRITP